MSSVSTLKRTTKNCEETVRSYTASSLDLSPNSRKHWNPHCWRNFDAWLQKGHANNVSNDGTNIREKTVAIITHFEIDRSTIFSGWINRFKRRRNTDTITLAGESWSVDSKSTYDWQNDLLLLWEIIKNMTSVMYIIIGKHVFSNL
jgi:hypothetical protein